MGRFHPEKFDLDIRGRRFVGKGRGKGWAVVARWSYLEHGVPPRLTDRLLALVKLLYDNNVIDEERLRSEFGIPASETSAEDGGEEFYEVGDDMESELDHMLGMVEEVRDPKYWSRGDTKIEKLRAGVRMLVDEVEASDAGA